MTRQQRRRHPRDDEEAAAFKGLGQVITVIRERRGLSREELADKAEMTIPELRKIEQGELDEWWGGIRMIAKAFGMPVPALMKISRRVEARLTMTTSSQCRRAGANWSAHVLAIPALAFRPRDRFFPDSPIPTQEERRAEQADQCNQRWDAGRLPDLIPVHAGKQAAELRADEQNYAAEHGADCLHRHVSKVVHGQRIRHQRR